MSKYGTLTATIIAQIEVRGTDKQIQTLSDKTADLWSNRTIKNNSVIFHFTDEDDIMSFMCEINGTN